MSALTPCQVERKMNYINNKNKYQQRYLYMY